MAMGNASTAVSWKMCRFGAMGDSYLQMDISVNDSMVLPFDSCNAGRNRCHICDVMSLTVQTCMWWTGELVTLGVNVFEWLLT